MGFIKSKIEFNSSVLVEGPHLMPIGLSKPLQNSTCALSINLVLSPIHKKCADVL